MKIKNLFDQIFSDENLYGAIQDASRGRRYHKDVLAAQFDCWNIIRRIQQDVYSGHYTVDRYYIFYVYEPKKRMIMSITFYHRIVQWAIYRVLNPLLVKGYIRDSYGCVPGRGALSAMERLKYWVNLTNNKPGKWYYLKLDISKYFYRISHEVLKKILAKKIKDERLLWVLGNIIDCPHTPFGLPPGMSPGEVPVEERLYDTGMPIGNLLSQVFANIYLDALDQYCKRVLRIHFYVRYMDDVIILSDSKERLHEWKENIRVFLEDSLRLNLNKKTCIRPVSQGIEFVGYRIWPHYVTIRKSTTLQMGRALRHRQEEYRRGAISMKEAFTTLECYLGMLKHCDCKRFRAKLIEDFVLTRDGPEEMERGTEDCESGSNENDGKAVRNYQIASGYY